MQPETHVTDRSPSAGPAPGTAGTVSGPGTAIATPPSAGGLARVVAPDGILGDRYELGPRVGAGGMATIFRAHDPVLERDVAVKVVHAHLAGDPALLRRFRHEARNAASLDHPNVVHVYDAGVEDLPYIVMELIDGPSLRQVLLDRGHLSPGEALTVAEPIARALSRAHERGVIHRDVKPENVLLSSEGQAKIADFGIARTVAATSHTSVGALLGTVHYLAPEVVDGGEATAASDQYALGIVVFESLTGRKAFPGDSPTAIALRHVREDVPAPSSVVSGIPRGLDRVVARATDRNPARRFPDLAAFADALHAAVPGGAVPLVVAGGAPSGDTLVVSRDELDTASVDALDDVPARTPSRRGVARLVPTPLRRDGRRDRRRSVSVFRPRRPRLLRGHGPARGTALALVVLALAAVAGYALWNYAIAPVRTVPDLAGLAEADAEEELAALGLSLEVDGRAFDRDEPAGDVVAQEPGAQGQARRGDAVGVTLSRGLGSAAVPDVIGSTVEEATALLDEANLGRARVTTRRWSDDVPEGEIMEQGTPSGSTVDWLTEVPVTVSRGIEQVAVPDVSGMDVDEATAALTDANLEVATTEEFTDEVPAAGDVVSQAVDAGATVDKGTTVDLLVSAGPVTFDLPDVRGEDLDAAVSRLESAGLSVAVREEPVPTVGPFRRGVPGRAEELSPQAGTTVTRGDDVTLYTFVE